MEKKDARSMSGEAQQELRIRAVKAVQAGHTQKEAAELFKVTAQAVYLWMRRYKKGGMRALKAGKRGRPKGISLEPWQAAQTAKAVVDRTPEQLKLPFYLWTRDAVAALIKRRFNISLSRWTVGRYLKRWGFTPQKPIRRAYEQNPQAVRQWLERDYPAIRRKAARERAEIHWCDETGLRSDHAVGRTYGRRGKTPAVAVTGKRFSCNMISTVTNQGTLRFMVFREGFSGSMFLRFIRRLAQDRQQKVYVIVDRHRAHRAVKVRKWVSRHADRIALYYLPPYSPELNPDEMLNQDVKSNAVRTRRSRTQDELVGAVRCHLRSRQKTPKKVSNYFDAETVRYARA